MSQKSKAKFIYHLTMARSKKMIQKDYGNDFWIQFKENADITFKKLIADFQDIGESMFEINYAYASGYVAWYTSMEKVGLDEHACDVLMLKMNEKMLLTVPKPLLHAVGKTYYRNMQKGAIKRMKQNQEKSHPFDWTIDYYEIDNDNFAIDIKRCGFIAYTKKYGGEKMLPGICQVDYMISHYMNVGFSRTKTIGAGENLCDCKYNMCGSCDWDIEKMLEESKSGTDISCF